MPDRLGPFLAELAAIEASNLRTDERDSRIDALLDRLMNGDEFPELRADPAVRARMLEEISSRVWAAASNGHDVFARAAVLLRAMVPRDPP